MEGLQTMTQNGEELVEVDISLKHLITLIVTLVIIFGCISFFVYDAYKDVKLEQVVQRQLIEEQQVKQNSEAALAQERIIQQQATLSQTQDQLMQAKQASLEAKESLSTISSNLQVNRNVVIAPQTANSSAYNNQITAADLETYMSAVVQILCRNAKGEISHGSGSLWKFGQTGPAIVTNLHVVQSMESCVAIAENSGNDVTGIFSVEGKVLTFNTATDAAVVSIGKGLTNDTKDISSYNFKTQALRKCPQSIEVGSPVTIIGFPSYAKRDSTIDVPGLGTIPQIFRTVTNGIVSGYDTSVTKKGLLKNFFVSAKIDSGNSGGVALAKDSNGLCLLGLPSWLSVGSYENAGLVQNIKNVIPE